MTDITEGNVHVDPLLVPGRMHCAKCKFSLTRVNLYFANGTTGPGGNETEPCPNGCGPLWPVTWEQEAREAWATSERIFESAQAQKKKVDDLSVLVSRLAYQLNRIGGNDILARTAVDYLRQNDLLGSTLRDD